MVVLVASLTSARAAEPTAAQREAWLAQLSDGDWILKADALAQLASHRVAAAADPIAKLLEGREPPYIQARALVALASLKPQAALKPALSLVTSPEAELRLAAVEALGVIGDASGRDAAAKAVNDDDPAVQRAAIRTYARLHGKAATKLVTNRLRADDPRIAADAAAAIAYTDPPVARHELIAALSRPEDPVRLAAVQALGELDGGEAVQPLLDRLASDTSRAVQQASLSALQRFDAKTLEPALAQAMVGDDAHRAAAVAVVRAAPDPRFTPSTVRLVKDPATPTPVLLDALAALGTLGGRDAQWAIRQRVSHSEPAVRARALSVLAPADDDAWWLLLPPRLRDDDADVRHAAFAALARADVTKVPGGLVELMAPLLTHEDTQVVRQAAAVLREHSDQIPAATLVQALTPVLGGPDDDLRRQTAAWLDPLVDKTGQQAIIDVQGYITQWMVAMPFPSDQQASGMAKAYPPEDSIDLTATYPRDDGDPVEWQARTASGEDQRVVLSGSEAWSEWKVAYLVADLDADAPVPVRFHITGDDLTRLWLNGKPLTPETIKDAGHVDAQLDRGRNRLLIKLGNNKGLWHLSVRVTDPSGRRVPGVRAAMPQ